MRFNITLPPGSCFGDIALTLVHGLGEIGTEAKITDYLDARWTNVLLGGHLVAPAVIADDTILYNFEQIGGSRFLHPSYYEVCQRCQLWDYSSKNVQAWRRLYDANPVYMPLGYVSALSRIPRRRPEFDVLFYGLLNPGRIAVLEALAKRGLTMRVAAGGITSQQLDELIAHARIVLNIHYYDTRIFEIARVSYLLANHKAVITEDSSDESDYAYLKGGIVSVPYEGLVDACLGVLRSERRRGELEEEGYRLFSRHREADILSSALHQICA